MAAAKPKSKADDGGEEKDFKSMQKKNGDQTKSQTVLNNKFDEALEFSRSGSDESFDTRASQKKPAAHHQHAANPQPTVTATSAHDLSQSNDSEEPSPVKPQDTKPTQVRNSVLFFFFLRPILAV